jgi:hypothetical protein
MTMKFRVVVLIAVFLYAASAIGEARVDQRTRRMAHDAVVMDTLSAAELSSFCPRNCPSAPGVYALSIRVDTTCVIRYFDPPRQTVWMETTYVWTSIPLLDSTLMNAGHQPSLAEWRMDNKLFTDSVLLNYLWRSFWLQPEDSAMQRSDYRQNELAPNAGALVGQ